MQKAWMILLRSDIFIIQLFSVTDKKFESGDFRRFIGKSLTLELQSRSFIHELLNLMHSEKSCSLLLANT